MYHRTMLFLAIGTLGTLLPTVRAADDAPTATPADQLNLLPGFKAELLYSVPRQSQGSWVSLAVDPRGRLIASDQSGKLYRIVPPAAGDPQAQVQVDQLQVDIGMAHGMLYAFDSLYLMVNGGEQIESGLYRLRDTDGDDQFDEVKLLRAMKGRGEHGPHAIVLSPDGKSLYLAAGNHTDLPGIEKSLVPRVWQEDLLLARMWDARGHAAGRLAPGGWIAKTDPDGTEFELMSIGYRNEFDIAFDANGELFTYDADMEWDIGTPWYRPTRILHVTSGSEFGWRSGTGKWPDYYPDSLPSVVNVGPGSPTGVAFGTAARFPAAYQRALFAADWSYGLIYAVHLQASGASFSGTLERFVSGAPLPVTDMVVNPHDGAFYFTIGGRGTQSGLYRITYAGDEPTERVGPDPEQDTPERSMRRMLEQLHHAGAARAVEKAWPYLSHPDRHLRYAARIAVELQPVQQWQERALGEKEPEALITAMIALAREGDKSLRTSVPMALSRIDWGKLGGSQRLDLLRAYALAFVRLGQPDEATRTAVLQQIDGQYPATSAPLNRELCQLLVYLEAPDVVPRTLDLLARAPTQEEQIHYVLCLRTLAHGWTLPQRQQYFAWFHEAVSQRGGMSFEGFLKNIRSEAMKNLTDDEREALKAELESEPAPAAPVQEVNRPFVKKWTVQDLLADVENSRQTRDLGRGRELFATTLCFKCHRFNGEGGINGPDLTAVGTRYNAQNMLESIIEPDKVISDQYQSTQFRLADGRTVVGRIINLNRNDFQVLTNMLDPSDLRGIRRGDIEDMRPSPTSLMPTGLLDTLHKDEILDLIAYLRAGAPH